VGRISIESKNAPRAIGPYSQACRSEKGKTLYLSGQIPLDPQTGEMVTGDATRQAERCLENLKAVLEEAGLSMDNVLRCTIYLTDLRNFAAVNEVYGRYFRPPYPARVAVQVAALPRGAAVEIDAVAE
jgi:2-iminobutanoate/2-iminopropanoate deaminase